MTSLALLWLRDYGLAAATLVFALCLGYPLARRFLRGPATAPLMVLVGLTALSLIVCLLSWMGWLTRLGVLGFAAVGAAASARCLLIDVPAWRRTWSPPAPRLVVCLATIAVVVLGFSWFALYPVIASDATNYHLPLARELVVHHGFHYDPFVRYSFFPQANEGVFAVMLMMSRSPTASGALEYSVLAVAVSMLPLWFAGSGRSPGAGLVAGLVTMASPIVIWAGTVPFVDVWTLTFVLAGTLVGLDAAEGRMPAVAGFVLMGGLLGEAAATKYTGIVFGLCGALAVAVSAGRSGLGLRVLLGAATGAALVGLPWYAWTLHATGDPLYPFATNLFGNRRGLWTDQEIQLQTSAARAIPQVGAGAILKRDIQYLLGHVLYNTGPDRSPLSWWLGAGYLGFAFRGLRRDRTFLGLALAGLLCIGFVVTHSADPRYFVPAIGLFSLLAGLAANAAIGLVRRRLTVLTGLRLAPAWCAVACAAGLFSSAGYVRWWYDSSQGRPPTRRASITRYLTSELPCYAAVAYLNHRAGSTYRAWGTDCESAIYYARGRMISDVFSTGSTSRVFNDYGASLPSARVLWRRLEPLHVSWLILSTHPAPPRAELTRRGLFRYVTTQGPEEIFTVAKLRGGRRS